MDCYHIIHSDLIYVDTEIVYMSNVTQIWKASRPSHGTSNQWTTHNEIPTWT